MHVPFVDLGAQHREIKEEVEGGLQGLFQRGGYILGQEEKDFEKEFAAYCGTRFAVGVNSGTDALFLSLKALGIGKGDEVIVPTFTYIATALAVTYTGARPVFVDIEEDSCNINSREVIKAVTRRTKAIIPVHLYGRPAPMAALLEISRRFKLKIVEDACQAHGALCRLGAKEKKVGSIGDVGCFSFYPTKNLGACGDGGMVATNNPIIYKKLLKLRDYGRVDRYRHAVIGYNSRLDTLQAIILRAKLRRLDAWNEARKASARLYNQLLTPIEAVGCPALPQDIDHVYHLYVIRTKERKSLMEALAKEDISTLIHYPLPIHLQPAYKDLGYARGDFPVAERIAREILSLPMCPHLEASQIHCVVDAIRRFFR